MRFMRLLFAASLAALPATGFADPAIQVDHAWSRAMPEGGVGVVYLTIDDHGEPDTLVSVSSPVAPKSELHQSFDDNGVMKMRPVTSLPVAPGKPVTLEPGGYHVMLVGLKQALVAGGTFPLTLTFAKAGAIATTVQVAKAGARMPPMDHGGMEMSMPSGQPHKP